MSRPAVVPAVAVGAVAGLTSGFFGVGGGLILVPGLVLLGLAQHRAHATSLAAIVLTAAAALQPFAGDGSVAWPQGAAIAAGAVAGAVGGAGLMHRLPARRLRQGFAVLLVVMAVRLVVPMEAGALTTAEAEFGLVLLAGFVALGLAAGGLSGLLGVGGGVILVPGLVFLFGFGQHAAEGTSLLVIIPTAIIGAWRHHRHGYTDWSAGALLGVAGVVGGQIGARIAVGLPEVTLQLAFGVFLLLVGIRLAYTAFRNHTDSEK